MKFIAAATLFTLASAHDLRGHHTGVARLHAKRQASITAPGSIAASTSSSAVSTSTTSVVSTSTASAASGTSAVTKGTTTSAAVPVVQTTPLGPGTDIPPLSAILSGAAPEATASVTSIYPGGATPPVSGAPALPTFVFSVSDWPPMDKIPDTSSSEVQQWLKELDGFDIPDLKPTVDGTCVGDPAAAADAANRGWWTCGGYTRSTDIVNCPDKLTWGMSFDDGPSPYSKKLLNFLNEKDLTSTFFVVGSRVIEYPNVLREEYMTGHELSVHTWSHPTLTKLTNEQIVAELGWTRKAIRAVTGVTPTTMRPPYGDIDDRVRAIALAMGLQPVIWTRGPSGNQFDTNDWKVPGGIVTGPESFQSFQYILNNATEIDTGFIVLEHDLFQQTVDIAVGYTLNAALSFTPKLTLEPIGKCQGWPAENMYLETTTNTTFPYPDSLAADAATTTASARANAATAKGAAGGNGNSSGAARISFVPALSSLVAGVSVLVGALLIA